MNERNKVILKVEINHRAHKDHLMATERTKTHACAPGAITATRLNSRHRALSPCTRQVSLTHILFHIKRERIFSPIAMLDNLISFPLALVGILIADAKNSDGIPLAIRC